MNIDLTLRRLLFTFSLLMFSMAAFAQLPNFTLTVTPTPQTCLGNGMLNFSVSGTNPSASIDYAVYLLPDTTTPVGITTSSFLGSLSAGDYMVVATQSLGGNSNTQNQTVTIEDDAEELDYLFDLDEVLCGNDGVITVNVVSGSAVSYEIISGPVTRPQQPSNVFYNLPVGLYQVRVHDICGNAVVISVQLTQTPAGLTLLGIGPVNYQPILPDCNTITIKYAFHNPPGTTIAYPVMITFEVYPPGGGTPTIVTTETMTNLFLIDLPYYQGEEYSCDISAVDACGNVYTLDDAYLHPYFAGSGLQEVYGCEDFSFGFMLTSYLPPLEIEFISAPAGFIPSDYSPLHPTFNSVEDIQYGSDVNSVPLGEYTAQITDSCGQVLVVDFEVEIPELDVEVVTLSAGCDGVSIELEVPTRLITEATLISAPVEYPETLPQDMEDFITGEGKVFIDNVPFGVYIFELTDSCGATYTKEVVATTSTFGITVLQLPGCEEGYGSVSIKGAGTTLTSVVIESAPAEFTQSVPLNVTFNLNSLGIFYMNSLPEGDYIFSFVSACGATTSQNITIEGYHKIVNGYTVTENCGSFALNIQNASNGTNVQAFYLQKYYPQSDSWGHPDTGVLYNEGDALNGGNSLSLINNANNINLAFSGKFRVIKSFVTYSNGISTSFKCTEVLHEFFISGGPQIIDYYNTPCLTGNVEVAIVAEGIAPLNYSVIQMNGESFFVDNGESGVFTGLVPGTYVFRVTDSCGNYRNAQLDLNEVQPIEITASNLCEGMNGELSVPQFSFLSYEWYKGEDPDTILSTSNTLDFSPFNGNADSGTYYVRVFTDNPVSCMNQILEYEVVPSAGLNAGDDDTVLYCNDGAVINLENFLSNPHDEGGVWSDVNATGVLSGNELDISGLEEGTYEFRYIVTGMCNMADEAVIILDLRDIPEAPQADSVAAICEGEDVSLSVADVANAAYEWTGPDNFTSTEQNPVITTAGVSASGTYQVRVVVNGCASLMTPVDVVVKELPAFEITGDASLCEGQSGQLEIVNENFDEESVAYQWYFDNDLLEGVDAPEIEIYETGTYTVTVNNNGCIAEEAFEVVQNTTAFDVVLENGCRDFDYMIWVANTEELDWVSYNWTGPEGFNAVGPEINISQMAAGIYTVEAVNGDGCSVMASVTVENTFCLIPRGISPGDNDYNNEFDLSNLNVQELKIYNRYGLLVYEKQNYKNEWYGQSDKGELPTGTYYYVVTLSAGKQVTGWVYLQRNIN